MAAMSLSRNELSSVGDSNMEGSSTPVEELSFSYFSRSKSGSATEIFLKKEYT